MRNSSSLLNMKKILLILFVFQVLNVNSQTFDYQYDNNTGLEFFSDVLLLDSNYIFVGSDFSLDEFKKKSLEKRGNFAAAQGNISLDKRGSTLAIGATWDNKVRVYVWNGSTWEKRGDDIVVGGGILGWSDSYQRRFSEEQ